MVECCFCKEYLNTYNNQYYNSLGKRIGFDSRVLTETSNWYAIPTLGCLTVGYVLLVCKQHYSSLATLNEKLYKEMLELKYEVEETLFQKLGLPCLAFEHGTTDSGFVGANSVDHVHLHIVPFSKGIWPDLVKKNNLKGFSVVSSYEDLFLMWKNNLPKTYLLFQDINRVIYYKPDASGTSSQFFRKCLVPYLNINQWDWKRDYYQANFIKTLELFKI